MPTPALTLRNVSTCKGGGLLALAADRWFETTRAVYALYNVARDGLIYIATADMLVRIDSD